MKLHELSPAANSKKSRTRVGRGTGSGHGKTSSRGHKGQKARAGYSSRSGFEGGQMPLQRRLPKRGFNNIFRKNIESVNITLLDQFFEDKAKIDRDALISKGLISKRCDGVKILGNGETKKKFEVSANAFSASAKEKLEAAGGSVKEI
ncbi:MAG: 50S ribosomal protein L15 [Clostridia bacterium]|nr:50S ribosomal protein L15 [Clostridia bacterium]